MILRNFRKTIGLDDSALQQYERLRSQTLNRKEAFSERSLGLVLFIRRGMLAWMEVYNQCMLVDSKPNKHPETPAFGYQATSEMIKVMANITLYNLDEAPL
jgi:hypothetical protein